MAQLWIQESNQWAVLTLSGTRLAFADFPLATDAMDSAALLVRESADDRAAWQLVARRSSGIAVNGLPLLAGIRTLIDQDEIREPFLGTLYFSTERLAQVERFPVPGHEVSCPRCRQVIAPDSPAVCCPGCSVWHHGSAELPCWTYSVSCALCHQETALDNGFQWTPEEL